MTAAITFPQAKALGGLVGGRRLTARQLHVRSDVLWRLEGRGYVRQNVHGQWYLRTAGEAAYEDYMARLIENLEVES